MKAVSFVLLGLFAGYSQAQSAPMNFVCTQTGNMYPPQSLSIASGKAVFGSDTYQKFCTKTGNSHIYGFEADDCENRKVQTAYRVRILSIDVITGEMMVVNKTPQDASIGTTFQCLRLKSK
jgi:hypothetical protein